METDRPRNDPEPSAADDPPPAYWSVALDWEDRPRLRELALARETPTFVWLAVIRPGEREICRTIKERRDRLEGRYFRSPREALDAWAIQAARRTRAAGAKLNAARRELKAALAFRAATLRALGEPEPLGPAPWDTILEGG